MWRGQAFGELAYEDYARSEAERLEELGLLALEEQSAAQLRIGSSQAVVGELRELAIAHPLRERMQPQVMLGLYRCGRQTEAPGVYAKLQERLRALQLLVTSRVVLHFSGEYVYPVDRIAASAAVALFIERARRL